MLVFKNAKSGVTPNANPQHEPVEYSSRWVSQSWVYVGHVDFMLFVSFLVTLGAQCKCNIQWNTGLRNKMLTSTKLNIKT